MDGKCAEMRVNPHHKLETTEQTVMRDGIVAGASTPQF
jgi:hypothetical protein